MKRTLSLVLIVCMVLSLSACGSRKNTDGEKAEIDTNVTSQTDNDLEYEPPFSLDAKPVDGKEYIGDGFSYVIYDDNSIEIMSYTGNKAEISIPSEINDYLVSRIASSAFENCTFLEEVNIWADVIIIGESAFKGCTNLKEISIPSSVSEIYDSTFEGCTNLEEANIWGDVIRIGVNAFKNCVSLKEISVPNSCLLVDKSAFEGCTDMEEVNLWGGEVIGECAFKNCTSLKEISIPSEVTVIKESAFEGCKSLKEVNVWGDNVTFGVNVFANCPKLEELPDGAYPDGVYSDDSSNTPQDDNKNDNADIESKTPEKNNSSESTSNGNLITAKNAKSVVEELLEEDLEASIKITKLYFNKEKQGCYVEFKVNNSADAAAVHLSTGQIDYKSEFDYYSMEAKRLRTQTPINEQKLHECNQKILNSSYAEWSFSITVIENDRDASKNGWEKIK